MKSIMLALVFLVSSLAGATSCQSKENISSSNSKHSFVVNATNRANISRPDAVVAVDLQKVQAKFPAFNEKAFFVTYRNRELPSQLDDENNDGTPDKLLFLSSFAPQEEKQFVIVWKMDTVENQVYPKMTQAALGVKVDYKKLNGYYTGGKFVDVDSATVPSDHFAHDALYRIEGPGWESDKIVYRYYLDSRNRNDIFGKKTHELVLQKIGVGDLVSNSEESYTKMLSWGMDIFKVGESLGIGSLAMWHGSKVVTVSDVSEVRCNISNGPIRSGVFTKYLGWKVGSKKYDLFSRVSISAGSRLTKVNVFIDDKDVQLCTGLAKHEDCALLKSSRASRRGWAYLALYGKQSLAGDNLGIAVFYRRTDEVKLTQDGLSEVVVLRPSAGRLTYYFGAAWQDEPGGIKSEKGFKRFLDDTIDKLNNPIEVSL